MKSSKICANHTENGISIRRLAKDMKMVTTTMYDIIIRYGGTNSFEDKPGRGR